MPATRKPLSETTKVIKLIDKAAGVRTTGRPKKLTLPGEFQQMLDAMSELEQEHYHFYIAAHEKLYPDLTEVDRLILRLAACDYIKALRMNAEELESGQLLTMSRQHPGVQMRAWMDMLSVTRKQRGKAEDKDPFADKLAGLSA
jgi:hypothetical protein